MTDVSKGLLHNSPRSRERIIQISLLLLGFCLIVSVVHSLLSYSESQRRLRLRKAIDSLCYGMSNSDARRVLGDHGISLQPLEGEPNNINAFRDSGFTILDFLDSDKQVTCFRTSKLNGLWLVYTQRYRFFIDDAFPRVEYQLKKCDAN